MATPALACDNIDMGEDGPRPANRQRKLFLDCDGVLADFDLYAETIFGMPPRIAQARLGSEAFWEKLLSHSPDIFRHLQLHPDAQSLFERVAHLHPTILTGCPRGGWAEPQKVAWAAEHFPGTPIITCKSEQKRLHMRPRDVLVDDYEKYRHLWEEFGGIFILHRTLESTLDELRAIFPDIPQL